MSDTVEQIAAAIENAVEVKPVQEQAVVEASGELPAGCPVTPLGRKDNIFYYMDANRQLAALSADKHGHLNLKSLFAPYTNFCEANWPRYNKDGAIVGTDWSSVSDALMNACAKIGPIDLGKRVRGSGAWTAGDGRLLMHCGDRIVASDQVFFPGKVGDHIYPAAAKIPYPSDEDHGTAAGEEVIDALKTWNWERPDTDPHLMLGWIGAALVGGALDWRPLVWVTGDKATGKSTLQKLVNYILSDDAVVSVVDTSAAGVRQEVGHMSLPVAVDELEAEEDNRKSQDIIKLARFACSGGQVLRGGADHKSARFVLMNCFMFSSILIPPMLGQDVSRMAILELGRLDDVVAPTLQPDRYKHIGMQFRRRMLDRWADFGVILEKYRMALGKVGHTGRSADQFGTLYACHDLLVYDGVTEQHIIDDVAERLDYSILAEAADDVADWERCIAHLMSCQLDTYRGGERKSVGDWVMQAANMLPGVEPGDANKVLSNYGMRVKYHGGNFNYYTLQVANAHRGLNELFKETHWAGRSGASGVWVQSLRRVPGAVAGRAPTTFNGVQCRYTEIEVVKILKNEEGVSHARMS